MFLGLQWYGWLGIAAALALLIPIKIKWMKWWKQRRQETARRGKWGEEDD